MSMVPEILESIVKNEGLGTAEGDDLGELESDSRQGDVQRVVETHHARLVEAADLVRCGLAHFLFALELISAKHLDRLKKTHLARYHHDEEARGESLNPGDQDFTSMFENQLHAYYARRKDLPEALMSLEAFSEKHDRDVDGGAVDMAWLQIRLSARSSFSLSIWLISRTIS
jgi:hypothetical protein